MVQKLIRVFFVFIFFALLILLLGFFWYEGQMSPASTEKTPKSFLVLKGSSARMVGEKLADEGLVKNALVFRFYLRATGKEKKVLPGKYSLSPHLGMKEIVKILLKGPSDVWVLIPEGLRREQVAEVLATELDKGSGKSEFVEAFMLATKNKEGFLFPDTYLFPTDVGYLAVAAKMDEVFNAQTKELQDFLKSNKAEDNFSLKEIVTMASLIERETGNDLEKPVVSGILRNRLKIGMPLQIDASVQYAVAGLKCNKAAAKCENWWPVLTKDDLLINSPYNTYKNTGLPPGPIANAGLSSIRAAVYPEKSDLLFYLHDKDGNIHTAKTFEEHVKNINKYLK